MGFYVKINKWASKLKNSYQKPVKNKGHLLLSDLKSIFDRMPKKTSFGNTFTYLQVKEIKYQHCQQQEQESHSATSFNIIFIFISPC
jgi:hypothetical protein